MNDKQKTFLIVAVGSFIFWLFAPTMDGWTPDSIFEYTEYWFDEWYKILAFSLFGLSLTGFFLFKDK